MIEPLTIDSLRQALADEFRAAVEAIVGHSLTANATAAPAGSGWGTPIAVSGRLEGRLTVWVDDAGVAAIAAAMMGTDEAPEASVAADMLKGLWAQAVAVTMLKATLAGVALAAGPTAAGTLPDDGAGLALRDGEAVLGTLSMAGAVTVTPAAAAPPRADYPGNLAALLDIDLPLVVRFARTEMSLRSLAQLGPGSMVDMGRSPDAPVQLIIGSQVIAEGEVVVVSGNYGVRITSLVSAADRLRAMEL